MAKAAKPKASQISLELQAQFVERQKVHTAGPVKEWVSGAPDHSTGLSVSCEGFGDYIHKLGRASSYNTQHHQIKPKDEESTSE